MLYAAVRAGIFIALLLIVGTQTAAALARGHLADDPVHQTPMLLRVQSLVRPLLLVLLGLVAAKGALQVWSFTDPGEAVTADLVESVLLSGTWGVSWLMQVGATIGFLAVGLRHRGLAAALTVLLLAGQSGMGHAAGDNWPTPVGRLVDFTHLIGLGVWLGTLGILAIVAFPMLHGDERLPPLARLVRAFSLYARVGISLVITSGVIAAVVYIGPLVTVAESAWGRLLLLKLACMLGVMALGWYNWRVVTPALDEGNATAQGRLRTAVRLELLLGLVMLGLTAFMVATALPGEG